jgi:hypothetical protein
MALRRDHEIHSRRFGRNLGVGLTLAAFIAIVFAMTVVKITHAGMFQSPPQTQVTQ